MMAISEWYERLLSTSTTDQKIRVALTNERKEILRYLEAKIAACYCWEKRKCQRCCGYGEIIEFVKGRDEGSAEEVKK